MGKTIFITAAGQGIGRACAEIFVKNGDHVIATDMNLALLKGLNAQCFELDVRNAQAIQTLTTKLPTVDVLINCAGIVHSGTVLDIKEREIDLAFDVNLHGMIRTIQAFLPGMLAQKHGSIINIASVVGSLKGVPNRCLYGASKAAVIGLTKSVAADYVTQGICCNAICPGTVESPSLRERLIATGDEKTARNQFIARQPMGRLGTPEEIADLALYLSNAAYTTGQAITIDGGWTT